MHPLQRLENLPVEQKLLAAMLLLLAAVLLVANLAFIGAAYWITRDTVAPKSLQVFGRLLASPEMATKLLQSREQAEGVLDRIKGYEPLRQAAVYDGDGQLLAQLQKGQHLQLPQQARDIGQWRQKRMHVSHQVDLTDSQGHRQGRLLLVASADLPLAFYTGTLCASLIILILSLIFWLLIARQVHRSVTLPIQRLQELSLRVTREENYSLRAQPGNQDELGALAEAFNTMLARIAAREKQLEGARDQAQAALVQARDLARETNLSNQRLQSEIKERGKVEHKLTNFQNYLNSIIDSMPSGLIALDDELYVTQWNQEASALSGTAMDDALEQPITLAFPHLKPFVQHLRRTAEQHAVQKVERVSWLHQGEVRHYALTFFPLMGNVGHGVVIRIDDISQRLALEEVMVQSEKMLSVGGLAAGMAHEINNPLGAILHNVQNIRRRLSPDLAKNRQQAEALGVVLSQVNAYLQGREIPRLLAAIQEAGQRAAKIVSNMLTFSRRSERKLTECQLSALIDQALEIAGNDFDLTEGFDFKGLNVERNFDSSLEPVPVIANELEQVLLNLLKNAAQAIHQRALNEPGLKGRIVLRTQKRRHWAQISIQDNGAGMSEGVRKRLFEPFFTTKEVGQGTGLGLSVSYFIITNHHNGQMEVQSLPGQGAVFVLRLPLHQPEVAAES